jgi:hypothetical protein
MIAHDREIPLGSISADLENLARGERQFPQHGKGLSVTHDRAIRRNDPSLPADSVLKTENILMMTTRRYDDLKAALPQRFQSFEAVTHGITSLAGASPDGGTATGSVTSELLPTPGVPGARRAARGIRLFQEIPVDKRAFPD